MKLGMPQLFEYETLEENFRLAKKLNLDFIEFNLNFSSCRNGLKDKTLKALSEQYHLPLTLHFFDEADFGSYEEIVEAYTKLLVEYTTLGRGFVKQLCVHSLPGPVVTISGKKHYINEKEYDEYKPRLIKNLRRAQQICFINGVNFVIENTEVMPDYKKQVWMDLAEEGFHFCYDIGHDGISHGFVKKIMEKAGPTLLQDELHIHDGTDTVCHLALGEGNRDIGYYKELARRNNAYVVLEVKCEADLIKSVPVFRAVNFKDDCND